MKIEIIIPTFNNFNLVRQNLPKIIKSVSSLKNISISIVDDGSSINEQENLKAFVGSVIKKNEIKLNLMLFAKNVGFASNVNRVALESDSDLIVLLNSDVYPENKFLDYVLPYFADEKLFGVGMMDKSREGKKEVLRGRGLTYWKKGMFLHKRGEIDKNSTSWISGGSSVMRTSVFKKIGGFNKLYNPFYWEDIDISYVARKMGYQILFVPQSKVVHSHSQGSIKKHFTSEVVTVISYRNQLIFVWKNITDFNLLASHFLFIPYYLFSTIIRFDFKFLAGFLLAVRLLPDIMSSRRKLKEGFIFQDKQIIP